LVVRNFETNPKASAVVEVSVSDFQTHGPRSTLTEALRFHQCYKVE